jgi:hypothetical protein
MTMLLFLVRIDAGGSVATARKFKKMFSSSWEERPSPTISFA